MIKIALRKSLHAGTGPISLEVGLDIEPGSFVAITGASGAGKTTLLRLIAGLIQPDTGYLEVNGAVWLDTEAGICRRIQNRDIGMVFQHYALFPNMTVLENLKYGLRPGQAGHIIRELTAITELENLLGRYPVKLSGGQQQRVALARALVRQPKLLLLDEPLSALDARMRARLQNYILNVHKKYQLTTLLVSHDDREIFKLADRVIALQEGKMMQPDLPASVAYANLGDGAFRLSGEVLSIEEDGSGFVLHVLIGTNVVRVPAAMEDLKQMQAGDTVTVLFEAHHTVLER